MFSFTSFPQAFQQTVENSPLKKFFQNYFKNHLTNQGICDII
nr:MAG TPA: hypothetical protein [Caudoviricetes sp.]